MHIGQYVHVADDFFSSPQSHAFYHQHRPVHSGRRSVDTSLETSWTPNGRPLQPLYANAPPKPKRLNNSTSESSPEPSTEESISQLSDHNLQFLENLQQNAVIKNGYVNSIVQQHQNITSERRTPDNYSAGVTTSNNYEEIYEDGEDLLSLPIQSAHEDNTRGTSNFDDAGGRLRESYASARITEELATLEANHHIFNNSRKSLGNIQRPHSADFLEHDRRADTMALENRPAYRNDMNPINNHHGPHAKHKPQPTRSQSSMGQQIDIDYWSEENYAQKMRQSSLYHSKKMGRRTPKDGDTSFQNGSTTPSNNHIGQRMPPAGAATPDLYSNNTTPHVPNNNNSLNNYYQQNNSKGENHRNLEQQVTMRQPLVPDTDRLNVSVASSTYGHSNGSPSTHQQQTPQLYDNSFSRSTSGILPNNTSAMSKLGLENQELSLDSSIADETFGIDPDNKKVYQVSFYSPSSQGTNPNVIQVCSSIKVR